MIPAIEVFPTCLCQRPGIVLLDPSYGLTKLLRYLGFVQFLRIVVNVCSCLFTDVVHMRRFKCALKRLTDSAGLDLETPFSQLRDDACVNIAGANLEKQVHSPGVKDIGVGTVS